jgi:hypothetical protein
MKVIVAGSRSIVSYLIVAEAIEQAGLEIDEVVSGGASGVDKLGELWARKHNVKVKRFPAQWDRLGRRAGFVRNSQMADYAEALIAVWDGESRGTKHMIEEMEERGKLVIVVEVTVGKMGPKG